eukprot:jgi/Galph1/5029/GphlegSOOS_G62.1
MYVTVSFDTNQVFQIAVSESLSLLELNNLLKQEVYGTDRTEIEVWFEGKLLPADSKQTLKDASIKEHDLLFCQKDRDGVQDPFLDIGLQKALEERIRQENVAENLEAALEYNPEAFGNVVMLYILAKVNNVDVIAFVDSGANILLSLKNVQNVVPKVSALPRFWGEFTCPCLVLETNIFPCLLWICLFDVLFGLDMLRRHRAVIDLAQNCFEKWGKRSLTSLQKRIFLQD